MPDLSPKVQAYVALVRAAERVHAEVSRGLLVEGLTPSQFGAMKALCLRGPQPQKDIAASLLKTGGNVTLVVDNLEKLGFVERVAHPSDRRMSVIQITETGRETFDRIYPEHLLRIEQAMDVISDGDCDAIVGLMRPLSGSELPVCRNTV